MLNNSLYFLINGGKLRQIIIIWNKKNNGKNTTFSLLFHFSGTKIYE